MENSEGFLSKLRASGFRVWSGKGSVGKLPNRVMHDLLHQHPHGPVKAAEGYVGRVCRKGLFNVGKPT